MKNSLTAQLTYTVGAPCPTLVLDARRLPRGESALLTELGQIRRWLCEIGGGHVLKFALVRPSIEPGSDLSYQFIQALPGDSPSFDLRGSCGHSLLGAVAASTAYGMVPELSPGQRIRVNVQNNGDRVICEVEEASQDTVLFTVRFRYTPPKPVGRLLVTGEPQTLLDVDGGPVAVSLVSAGNPYAFVGAPSVGAASAEELFADRTDLLDRLVQIRRVAADRLGWPAEGAFPKIAAVLPAGGGAIAVRAVSVPGWHPTLALTGSVCLAAATRIAGTIPWHAASRTSPDAGTELHTANGRWPVSVVTVASGDTSALAQVTVGSRQVTRYGPVGIRVPVHLQPKEVVKCLSPSA